jgi:hypothetical protein
MPRPLALVKVGGAEVYVFDRELLSEVFARLKLVDVVVAVDEERGGEVAAVHPLEGQPSLGVKLVYVVPVGMFLDLLMTRKLEKTVSEWRGRVLEALADEGELPEGAPQVLVFPSGQREGLGAGAAAAAPTAVAPRAPAAAQPPDGGEEWARGGAGGGGEGGGGGLPSFARGNPWLDILARRR